MKTHDKIDEKSTSVISKRHRGWMRAAAILVIVAAMLASMRAWQWDQAIVELKQWIAGLGTWAPVVLGVLYVVATVLLVPGFILTLIAGALFGPIVGMVCVSIGSTVGASLAFIIARYVARDRVASFADRYPRFDAIDRAIGEGGWKVVALLRLSPAIPFNVQNYLYGLTRIRFWPYAMTSWLAMLPGTFLYVYLGHITGAALAEDRDRTVAEWLMMGIGLLATIAVTVMITRLARRQLRDQTGISE
ncbi:MAG: TVP38/TMEM64 family protein [Planctomycetaceae bacterium]